MEAKDSEKVPKKISFPKPDECGEDSYFIKENLKLVAFGVADGVSEAIGSKNFSRALMRHSADLVATNANIFNAANIIRLAFYRTLEESLTKRINNAGASTVCVISVDKETG